MIIDTMEIDIDGRPYELGYFIREASGKTLLFLHGLGCSMEDYRQAADRNLPGTCKLVGLDFPGHGVSSYQDKYSLNVDHLADVTERLIGMLNLKDVVLVGHSMGGLVAQLLIGKQKTSFSGFINLEGNLAPEDCIFTRDVINYDRNEFVDKKFFSLKKEMEKTNKPGMQQYAKELIRCNPWAYYDYSASIVEYTDFGNLLDEFLSLGLPRLFIYGEENAGLSYLPKLRSSSVKVNMIPGGTHFMYADNPGSFYSVIAQFIRGLP